MTVLRIRAGRLVGAIAVAVACTVAVEACGVPARLAGGQSASAGVDGYCLDLRDVIGLYVGNPITQMGVPVGEVTSVQNRGGVVRVTFALDDGRKYPASTRAITRSKSLLADRSVELVDTYASGAALEPGHCIPVERTFTPKSISEIAGSSADFVEQLSHSGDDGVRTVIAGADESLAGTGPTAESMYRHAASAAQNPEQFTSDIGSAVMNMAPLTQRSLADWSTISSLTSQLPVVLDSATVLSGYVQKFIRGIGWLVIFLYDVNQRYGKDLWPLLNNQGVELMHLLGKRAPDLAKLYSTIPSIAQFVHARSAAGRQPFDVVLRKANR